ncbi:MAG: NAD-binding protein [Bacteroidetes bacterium]|nr:NAD-binding protein [Bacteroidota bacterium]
MNLTLHDNFQRFLKRAKRRSRNLLDNAYVKLWGALFSIVVVSGYLVYWFEQSADQNKPTTITDWMTGIWWGFVTIFTIGYGDAYPATFGGRLTAVAVMIAGIAVISVLTATISSTFVEQSIRKGQGLETVKEKNHVVICGWNFNVEDIVRALIDEMTYPTIVLVNGSEPAMMDQFANRHRDAEIHFVAGDFAMESVLDRANIRLASYVIIVADTGQQTANKADEKTIIAALAVKNMNPKTRLFAHVVNPENLSHLRRAKVDDVVISDKYSGVLLARHITNPGVPRVVDALLALQNQTDLVRRPVPDSMIGKTFLEMSTFFKTEYNSICIGVTKETKSIAMNDLLSDDNSYLDQFIRQKLQESGRKFAEEERLSLELNPPADLIIEKHFAAIVIGQKKL